MKKLAIAALLVVAGCRGNMSTLGPRDGGANTPREAVERFLVGAKSQDYASMGLVFGSAAGPAEANPPVGSTRKQRKTWQADLRKRQFIMMKCLRHDRVQIGSGTATPTGNQVFAAQMWFRDLTATTNFTAVRGVNERWYVEQFEPDPVQKICASL